MSSPDDEFEPTSAGAIALYLYVPAIIAASVFTLERASIEFKFKQVIRQIDQPARRTMLLVARLLTLMLALRGLFFLLRETDIIQSLGGTAADDCVTGVSCVPSIIITTLDRTASFASFAAFGLLIVYLTRVKEFSSEGNSSVTASHQELLNESGSSGSKRGWWDFCFTFVVVWLVIIQVVIVLILIFDDTITAEQGDNVNNFFVIVIGLLFVLIGAGVLYQGVRVILLVNTLLDKYREWNERTSAAIVQIEGGSEDSEEEESGAASSHRPAAVAHTGAGSHAAILALPLTGASKDTQEQQGRRQRVDAASTLSAGSASQHDGGRVAGATAPSAQRQGHIDEVAPQYLSYGMASDAARASTLYGAVGGAGSVTGDSASSRPPPALDGVLKRLRLRTYGLTIILPLCFMLRGFLNLVQPTTASGAIEQQGTILFPWFSTVIPDILGSMTVLALTAPYACTCRQDQDSQHGFCWWLLGALQGGAMAVFDLLKEDCSACARCMCCCCPKILQRANQACSSSCQACAIACCGAAAVDRQAAQDWDAVESMIADGVPQRYFELHSGSQRILQQVDQDVLDEQQYTPFDMAAAHSTTLVNETKATTETDLPWGETEIARAIDGHDRFISGGRGGVATAVTPRPSAETSSQYSAAPNVASSGSSPSWYNGNRTGSALCVVRWEGSGGSIGSKDSCSSLSSGHGSVDL